MMNKNPDKLSSKTPWDRDGSRKSNHDQSDANDVTSRIKVPKVSLKNDTHSQLQKVSHDLYKTDVVGDTPAKDSQVWKFTDETLFREAKSSYENIIVAYAATPRVYRFESTKQKIWDDNDKRNAIEESKQSNAKTNRRKGRKQSITSTKIVQDLLRKRQQEEDRLRESSKLANRQDDQSTYLDPFAPPKPWKAEVKYGKTVYVNKETGDILETNPGEVYFKKNSMTIHVSIHGDGNLYLGVEGKA
jgi:hypothetical protein